MKKVTIYTTDICPYCVKAKRLLIKKGIEFQEMRVDENPALSLEARERSGGMMTVPQIFIEDQHIGGCDDLYALEHKNELDLLLED